MARGQKRFGKSNSNAAVAKKPAAPAPQTPEVISPKHFVLKHTFKKVSSMEEGEDRFSPIEDHFGLKLYLSMERRNGYFGLHLIDNTRQWYLSIEGRVRIFGRKEHEALGKRTIEEPPFLSIGWQRVSKWESVSHFLVDDSLTVEYEIRINEMAKVGKIALRSFDISMKDLSDVVLVVLNRKFYVSKYTLASHSQYFNSLFLGPYKEVNMSEITLKGVDPFDMQNYLEFLYHQPSITEDTVEGLLLLADQYDTGILKEKCEDFLIKDSKKSLKKKFKMFLKYNCAMEKIINEMRTYRDYKEMIAGEDVSQMDPKLMSQLLLKSVSFAS